MLIACSSSHTTQDIPTSCANREDVRNGAYVCGSASTNTSRAVYGQACLDREPPGAAADGTQTVRVRAELTRLPTSDAATSSSFAGPATGSPAAPTPLFRVSCAAVAAAPIPAKADAEVIRRGTDDLDAKFFTARISAATTSPTTTATSSTRACTDQDGTFEDRFTGVPHVLEQQQASVARDTILRKRGVPRSAFACGAQPGSSASICRAEQSHGHRHAKEGSETPFMEPMRGDYVLCLCFPTSFLYRLPGGARSTRAACYRQSQDRPSRGIAPQAGRPTRSLAGGPNSQAACTRPAFPKPASTTRATRTAQSSPCLSLACQERLQHQSRWLTSRAKGL